ncbi:MAG: glycerophosphodiester phosphodiesterase [Egibacteraceae bacterium]
MRADLRASFLEHPRPLAIAHRGGSTDGTENSLAAFRRAAALGYRYLETDVHLTADGVLVALHDDRLDRTTDSSGAIGELSWETVRAARIGGREPVPRFAELLEELPRARFVVDPKADAAVKPLRAAVRDAGAQERVCIGSFEQDRLRAARRALPEVCTSMGPWEVRLLRAAAWGLLPARAVPRRACVVQVPEWYNDIRLVDAALVGLAHRLGMQVHVWTVNDRSRMHALLDLGVDGLITDEAVILRAVLIDRGAWVAPDRWPA